MNVTTEQQERAAISAALSAHLARQRAARILDEQRQQRAAIRAAEADAKQQRGRKRSAIESASGPIRPNVDALAAARIDAYRQALSYPMTPAEVLRAVQDAVSACGLRWQTDESAHETVGILVMRVIERHGRAPIRARVGRQWLRTRAQFIYDRECERRERATGLSASASLSEQWAADDEVERATDGSGPDAVWLLAANKAAPAAADALSAHAAIARLESAGCLLTERQREALALTLASQQRVTVALSSADRKAGSDARSALRKRFPTIDALRFALNRQRAMLAAIDAAKRIAARRWQPGGPWRIATVPERQPDGSYLPRWQQLPERQQPERPAVQLPDVGRLPLAVYPASGPRWRPVVIASDPKHPAHGGPECSGPRPHRAAGGWSAAGLTVTAEPKRTLDGWAAIRRAPNYRTRYRGVPRGPLMAGGND